MGTRRTARRKGVDRLEVAEKPKTRPPAEKEKLVDTIKDRLDTVKLLGLGRVILVDWAPYRCFVKWDAGSPTANFHGTFIVQEFQEETLAVLRGRPGDVFFGWDDGTETKSHCLPARQTSSLETVADKFGCRQDSPEAHFLTAIFNLLVGNFAYGHGLYAAAKNRWP